MASIIRLSRSFSRTQLLLSLEELVQCSSLSRFDTGFNLQSPLLIPFPLLLL